MAAFVTTGAHPCNESDSCSSSSQPHKRRWRTPAACSTEPSAEPPVATAPSTSAACSPELHSITAQAGAEVTGDCGQMNLSMHVYNQQQGSMPCGGITRPPGSPPAPVCDTHDVDTAVPAALDGEVCTERASAIEGTDDSAPVDTAVRPASADGHEKATAGTHGAAAMPVVQRQQPVTRVGDLERARLLAQKNRGTMAAKLGARKAQRAAGARGIVSRGASMLFATRARIPVATATTAAPKKPEAFAPSSTRASLEGAAESGQTQPVAAIQPCDKEPAPQVHDAPHTHDHDAVDASAHACAPSHTHTSASRPHDDLQRATPPRHAFASAAIAPPRIETLLSVDVPDSHVPPPAQCRPLTLPRDALKSSHSHAAQQSKRFQSQSQWRVPPPHLRPPAPLGVQPPESPVSPPSADIGAPDAQRDAFQLSSRLPVHHEQRADAPQHEESVAQQLPSRSQSPAVQDGHREEEQQQKCDPPSSQLPSRLSPAAPTQQQGIQIDAEEDQENRGRVQRSISRSPPAAPPPPHSPSCSRSRSLSAVSPQRLEDPHRLPESHQELDAARSRCTSRSPSRPEHSAPPDEGHQDTSATVTLSNPMLCSEPRSQQNCSQASSARLTSQHRYAGDIDAHVTCVRPPRRARSSSLSPRDDLFFARNEDHNSGNASKKVIDASNVATGAAHVRLATSPVQGSKASPEAGNAAVVRKTKRILRIKHKSRLSANAASTTPAASPQHGAAAPVNTENIPVQQRGEVGFMADAGGYRRGGAAAAEFAGSHACDPIIDPACCDPMSSQQNVPHAAWAGSEACEHLAHEAEHVPDAADEAFAGQQWAFRGSYGARGGDDHSYRRAVDDAVDTSPVCDPIGEIVGDGDDFSPACDDYCSHAHLMHDVSLLRSFSGNRHDEHILQSDAHDHVHVHAHEVECEHSMHDGDSVAVIRGGMHSATTQSNTHNTCGTGATLHALSSDAAAAGRTVGVSEASVGVLHSPPRMSTAGTAEVSRDHCEGNQRGSHSHANAHAHAHVNAHSHVPPGSMHAAQCFMPYGAAHAHAVQQSPVPSNFDPAWNMALFQRHGAPYGMPPQPQQPPAAVAEHLQPLLRGYGTRPFTSPGVAVPPICSPPEGVAPFHGTLHRNDFCSMHSTLAVAVMHVQFSGLGLGCIFICILRTVTLNCENSSTLNEWR
jgi:hypothetical protein